MDPNRTGLHQTQGGSLALILDGYRRACADSDEVIGRLAMDSIGAQTDGDYTLRWAMIHVLGDTVRHAGQADIIRELTDGRRGW